jgi:hypothetical protein
LRPLDIFAGHPDVTEHVVIIGREAGNPASGLPIAQQAAGY